MENDLFGFCHRHPRLEEMLGLDSNHVIVDKEDWEQVRNHHTDVIPVEVDLEVVKDAESFQDKVFEVLKKLLVKRIETIDESVNNTEVERRVLFNLLAEINIIEMTEVIDEMTEVIDEEGDKNEKG